MKNLLESNRIWHIALMIIPSLMTCLLCNSVMSGLIISLAVAGSLEFKDVLWSSQCSFSLLNISKLNWKSFDLLDFSCTIIGGVIGILLYVMI